MFKLASAWGAFVLLVTTLFWGCSTAPAQESRAPSAGCAAGTECGGLCVTLDNNSAHCGACLDACDPGSACVAGSCGCQGGLSACGGACLDTSADVLNCGGCGAACVSGQSCSAGECQCLSGLAACGTGCVDADSDPVNCGGCGNSCGDMLVCSLGECTDSCADGLTQCGQSCVSDLNTNPLHCGSCNNACPAGQECAAGACGCANGTTSCGGACRDTQTDVNHCGACGTACGGGATCVGGSCVCPAGQVVCTDACIDESIPCEMAALGDGVLVDGECFAVCADAASDDDADGYGFEMNRSCIVATSEAAVGAAACEPAPLEDVPEPGDGFYVGGECIPPCASDATDADDEGVTDGWGYENMTSCIVPGSAPATSALPCIPPEIDLGSGSGYQLQDECAPECMAPELADEQGYGYEQQRTCVAADSAAAAQATRCEPEPLEGAPEPGDGYYIVDSETMEGICHPACVYPEDADDGGWGYEGGRSCVAPGSTAALQALPCIPDDGVCPVVLDCPSVDNQAPVDCGCVEMAGLGARKAEIVDQMTAQSGHAMFLASAMMETDNLQADYPLGDNKTGDAFNAGLTKQNWGMIRSCHAAWNGLGSGDYMTCTAMNDDLALDVQVYTECRNQYGSDWYGGHRAGQPGSTSQDVRLFQNATEWTQQMLSDGHMDDDAYFWADITPI